MNWTTEKPTAPGAYWFRTTIHNAEVCRVGMYGNQYQSLFMVYFTDGERLHLDEMDECEWAGPLELPQP